MIKRIYIPGIPDIKMRPRATRNGRMYDPNAQAKEASIQKAQMSNEAVLTGALIVDMLFEFPRPAGHFGTGKNAGTLKSSAPVYCCNTKDLDNIAKFYCDSFNCIAYEDDRQIVSLTCHKKWTSGVPGVKITITQLEE